MKTLLWSHTDLQFCPQFLLSFTAKLPENVVYIYSYFFTFHSFFNLFPSSSLPFHWSACQDQVLLSAVPNQKVSFLFILLEFSATFFLDYFLLKHLLSWLPCHYSSLVFPFSPGLPFVSSANNSSWSTET